MKTLKFRGNEIEDTLTERALNSLYAFHAYTVKREKKLTSGPVRDRYSKNRQKYQVPGH